MKPKWSKDHLEAIRVAEGGRKRNQAIVRRVEIVLLDDRQFLLPQSLDILGDRQTCPKHDGLDLLGLPALEIPAIGKQNAVINGKAFYIGQLHQGASMR